MHPKDHNKAQRVAFWTAYGQYMSRHRPARGSKTKWLNYLTGIKDLYFRQHADEDGIMVSIDIQHRDPSLREVFYDQWWELETLLHSSTETVWVWDREYRLPTGEVISRIYVERRGLNLYDVAQWPVIFKFFERYMVPLDRIWENAYDIFKDLQD